MSEKSTAHKTIPAYYKALVYHKQLLLVLFLLLAGGVIICQKKGTSGAKKPKVVYGVASFYNKRMEGTKTATGEVFHHNQLMAASNQFSLNSWVRITNLKNGKWVIVRITDRMSKNMENLGRVADMTRLAAQRLDFINRGLARVKVEEIKPL